MTIVDVLPTILDVVPMMVRLSFSKFRSRIRLVSSWFTVLGYWVNL